MAKMQGLTWASIKKNPMLIPLFIVVGLGGVGAVGYMLRCAISSPDVSWFPKKNTEPWNEYRDKEYKFRAIHNPRGTKSPAPEY